MLKGINKKRKRVFLHIKKKRNDKEKFFGVFGDPEYPFYDGSV